MVLMECLGNAIAGLMTMVLAINRRLCLKCKREFTPTGPWEMVCSSCSRSCDGLDSEEGGG